MTHKWILMFTILAIAMCAVFVSSQMTQAQRPDRGGLQDREGRDRRGGGAGRFSPTSLIDGSWADLTFGVKVDDETLIKARLIYQRHRDKIEKSVDEARESGDFQSIRNAIVEIREGFTKERNAVLTREQTKALEVIERDRGQRMMRRGGGRGGASRNLGGDGTRR